MKQSLGIEQYDEPQERFEQLLARTGFRLERIVSPSDMGCGEVLCQETDEYVVLLQGGATLWVEGEEELNLHPGEAVLLPAGRRHQVRGTASGVPTVWLALHMDVEKAE